LAAYLTILAALDDRGPMLWVDDAVADLEHTRKPLPSSGTLNRITFPEGCVQTKSQVDGLFDVGGSRIAIGPGAVGEAPEALLEQAGAAGAHPLDLLQVLRPAGPDDLVRARAVPPPARRPRCAPH